MATKAAQSEKLEQTANEMRRVVKSAQRTLLEFEVMMSQTEIANAQAETFDTAEQLLKKVA